MLEPVAVVAVNTYVSTVYTRTRLSALCVCVHVSARVWDGSTRRSLRADKRATPKYVSQIHAVRTWAEYVRKE